MVFANGRPGLATDPQGLVVVADWNQPEAEVHLQTSGSLPDADGYPPFTRCFTDAARTADLADQVTTRGLGSSKSERNANGPAQPNTRIGIARRP